MLPDDPTAQARIFYLVLLGLVIASGAFYLYRGKLGKAVRDAAAWVLIFAGTVLLIAFWQPLQQALMGDRPGQVDERTVVLQRAGDGHFYVTADVNGRPVRFLVDTGASSLVLSWRDAERVGIDIGALDFRVPSMTANGMVMSAPVRVGLIELGAFVDEDVRAMVNGGDLDVSLLGMSYLSRYRGFEVDGDRFFLKR